MCATAEGMRTYMYMCRVCSPCVLYMRDHRVNPPSQPPSSSPLQKEQKVSEAVQSADKKSDPGSVAPADSSLVGNNSLF